MPEQQVIEGPDITNYWQYFNLDRDPFAMSAEDALIYLPSYWEEMLDLIQYLSLYKNQMVVVTGDSGIGKSVFCSLLDTQLAETIHIAKIVAEPNLDAARLVEFLSDAFSVPYSSGQNIEEALNEELRAFQSKEKNCLLLVDSAQLLPTDSLEALLYFVSQQSETDMRFHVVLFGEVALQLTLQRMLEPSEESLIHFLNLEPLSLEETQQYLNHRLSVSGWQTENPMSEEIVARIHRLSEGNPARINRIARRFLLDMLNEQGQAEQGGFMQKYKTRLLGALLIIIVLAIVSLWAWRSSAPQESAPLRPTISVNGQMMSHDQAPVLSPEARMPEPSKARAVIPSVPVAVAAPTPTTLDAVPADTSVPAPTAVPATNTAVPVSNNSPVEVASDNMPESFGTIESGGSTSSNTSATQTHTASTPPVTPVPTVTPTVTPSVTPTVTPTVTPAVTKALTPNTPAQNTTPVSPAVVVKPAVKPTVTPAVKPAVKPAINTKPFIFNPSSQMKALPPAQPLIKALPLNAKGKGHQQIWIAPNPEANNSWVILVKENAISTGPAASDKLTAFYKKHPKEKRVLMTIRVSKKIAEKNSITTGIHYVSVKRYASQAEALRDATLNKSYDLFSGKLWVINLDSGSSLSPHSAKK